MQVGQHDVGHVIGTDAVLPERLIEIRQFVIAIERGFQLVGMLVADAVIDQDHSSAAGGYEPDVHGEPATVLRIGLVATLPRRLRGGAEHAAPVGIKIARMDESDGCFHRLSYCFFGKSTIKLLVCN